MDVEGGRLVHKPGRRQRTAPCECPNELCGDCASTCIECGIESCQECTVIHTATRAEMCVRCWDRLRLSSTAAGDWRRGSLPPSCYRADL